MMLLKKLLVRSYFLRILLSHILSSYVATSTWLCAGYLMGWFLLDSHDVYFLIRAPFYVPFSLVTSTVVFLVTWPFYLLDLAPPPMASPPIAKMLLLWACYIVLLAIFVLLLRRYAQKKRRPTTDSISAVWEDRIERIRQFNSSVKHHQFFPPVVLLLAFLPLVMLLCSVYFLSDLLICALLAMPLVILCSVMCLWVGTVWLAVALIRRKPKRGALILIIIPCYLGYAFVLNTMLFAAQTGGNKRRGRIIGQAVVQFHAEQGRYPNSLAELWPTYLKRFPTCWYGALPSTFTYWLAFDGKPNLKFVTIPIFAAHFYVFEDDRWEESCL